MDGEVSRRPGEGALRALPPLFAGELGGADGRLSAPPDRSEWQRRSGGRQHRLASLERRRDRYRKEGPDDVGGRLDARLSVAAADGGQARRGGRILPVVLPYHGVQVVCAPSGSEGSRTAFVGDVAGFPSEIEAAKVRAAKVRLAENRAAKRRLAEGGLSGSPSVL